MKTLFVTALTLAVWIQLTSVAVASPPQHIERTVTTVSGADVVHALVAQIDAVSIEPDGVSITARDAAGGTREIAIDAAGLAEEGLRQPVAYLAFLGAIAAGVLKLFARIVAVFGR